MKSLNHILTLDLGNTTASAGIFSQTNLIRAKRLEFDSFPLNLTKWVKSGGYSISKAIYCSVNPRFNRILDRELKSHLSVNKVIQLGNFDVPVTNRYKNKSQVGVDRLVNVYGGFKFYGAPCLVIDIGTAITLDLGGPHQTFEGGLILPGPELMVKSLQQGTAKIGTFPFRKAEAAKLLGKSTRECVLNGALVGTGVMISGLIEKFRKLCEKKWHCPPKVVLTGGGTNLIKPYLAKVDHQDEFLTLKSICRIHGEKFSGDQSL